MSRREDQRDKKPRRQSKDSSGSRRANKTVKQTGKPTTPKGTKRAEKSKSKSGSKSDGKSQSIKSHLSAPQDDKSKSSSGGRRRIGTMAVADDDDDFDEFQPVVVKSLAHKSIDKNGQEKEGDGQQDPQTTLWNKSWMDEDDDADFAPAYEKEKK